MYLFFIHNIFNIYFSNPIIRHESIQDKVWVGLTQLVRTMHNTCKVCGSNSGHHPKEKSIQDKIKTFDKLPKLQSKLFQIVS